MTTPTDTTITVELQGHLIDSLTLAKVIDLIQEFGGDYELDNLCIGHQKNELSSVVLTIHAPTAKKLTEILEQVRPYGAHPFVNREILLEACPADGQIPERALIPLNLPREVRYAGRVIPINLDSMRWVVSFNEEKKEAVIKHARDVKQGEQVVMGIQGVQWSQIPDEGEAQ